MDCPAQNVHGMNETLKPPCLGLTCCQAFEQFLDFAFNLNFKSITPLISKLNFRAWGTMHPFDPREGVFSSAHIT